MASVQFLFGLVLACIFLSFLGSAFGACHVINDISLQPNFDANRYQGVWKEAAWIPPVDLPLSDYFHAYTRNYVLQENGNLKIAGSGRAPERDSDCTYYNLTMVPTQVGLPKYMVQENNRLALIVETDYVSYSVLYECKNVSRATGRCMERTASLWSRRGYLSLDEYKKVELVLVRLCLTKDMFVETTHESPCSGPNALKAKGHTSNPGTTVVLLVSLAILLHEMFRNQ